ncbi:ABC transporter permease [Cohnella sp. GCM10020058]|uniref:ABC transporter permease n=1 Tax=Cohnella sp. GCM10020058 TaxID=3317330 RepID=UPI00363C34A9
MNKAAEIFNKPSTYIPFIAIVLGLLCGGIVMWIGGYNPFEAYGALWKTVFGTKYDFGETIVAITPILFTGLAVGFAFRAGIFNIGADGQYIIGMTAATFIGLKVHLPAFIHAPLALIVGMLCGGLWGALVGWLKAYRGVNEVISAIMLNWIALYLSNYILRDFLVKKGEQKTPNIDETASLSIGWLKDFMEGARMDWGIWIGLLCVVIFYVLLWRTKQGYELRAVGHNADAAKAAGINIKASFIKTMMISGAFAGLGGVFSVLGVFHYQVVQAASAGYGFDGIAVALLGGNHPVGILLGAILFGGLTYGSAGMNFEADVPSEIVRIVIGSIIFFVASHGLIRTVIQPLFKKRKSRERKGADMNGNAG